MKQQTQTQTPTQEFIIQTPKEELVFKQKTILDGIDTKFIRIEK